LQSARRGSKASDADVADVCPDIDATIAASPFANIELPAEGLRRRTSKHSSA
jgi:hypothetical protein